MQRCIGQMTTRKIDIGKVSLIILDFFDLRLKEDLSNYHLRPIVQFEN